MTFEAMSVSTEATLVNDLSSDQMTSTCYIAPSRYDFLKDFWDSDDLLTPVTPNDPG